MAEIVNLRQARKRKRRDERERDAAANRLLHGQTGGEKAKLRLSRALDEKRLEGHRRDGAEAEDGGE